MEETTPNGMQNNAGNSNSKILSQNLSNQKQSKEANFKDNSRMDKNYQGHSAQEFTSQNERVETEGIDHGQVGNIKANLVAEFDSMLTIEKHNLEQQLEEAFVSFKSKIENIADDIHKNANMRSSELLGFAESKVRKPIFSEKVFENRDSLLTESTKKGKEAHTVFNIFVSVLLLIFLKIF